jgi:putative sigma-54 modulation protein
VQVAITCKHGQLGANQQEYISRKSEKLLTYFERVTAINVTVTFENKGARVEILVDAEHKHDFVADAMGDDVSPTFDAALHKMEQQIRKYKEKIQDHHRGDAPRDLPIEGADKSE